MNQTELETQLTTLQSDVAQMRAREQARVAGTRTVMKGVVFIIILFALVTFAGAGAAAWTGRTDLMLFVYPILFSGIALSFLNAALRAWSTDSGS